MGSHVCGEAHGHAWAHLGKAGADPGSEGMYQVPIRHWLLGLSGSDGPVWKLPVQHPSESAEAPMKEGSALVFFPYFSLNEVPERWVP